MLASIRELTKDDAGHYIFPLYGLTDSNRNLWFTVMACQYGPYLSIVDCYVDVPWNQAVQGSCIGDCGLIFSVGF